MAKGRRVAAARTTKKKVTKTARPARSRTAAPASVVRSAAPEPQRPPSPPSPPPAQRKPAYYEAIALYESGVRALQRHDFDAAATAFRSVLDRYPEERELHERARLYLRVCERETARRPAGPQTPQERVYAATVALNAGDHAVAMEHLRRALQESPDSDHAHYIMSVALASKGDSSQALQHLRQAITLNPENRAMARQDPDLEAVRNADGFRELLDVPAGSGRGKARKRR